MKYLVIFLIIGFAIAGSGIYFWQDSTFNVLAHTDCFEMGKIPKFDKLGDGYMVSCIDWNPFGK